MNKGLAKETNSKLKQMTALKSVDAREQQVNNFCLFLFFLFLIFVSGSSGDSGQADSGLSSLDAKVPGNCDS